MCADIYVYVFVCVCIYVCQIIHFQIINLLWNIQSKNPDNNVAWTVI